MSKHKQKKKVTSIEFKPRYYCDGCERAFSVPLQTLALDGYDYYVCNPCKHWLENLTPEQRQSLTAVRATIELMCGIHSR